MTRFTQVGGIDVCRRLTRDRGVVVTGDTTARNGPVIDDGRRPGRRRVTVVADIAARDMRRRLADDRRIVMTGDTGAEYV